MNIPKEIEDILEDRNLTADQKVLKFQTLNSRIKKLDSIFLGRMHRSDNSFYYYEEGKPLENVIKETEKYVVSGYNRQEKSEYTIFQCFVYSKPTNLSIGWDES